MCSGGETRPLWIRLLTDHPEELVGLALEEEEEGGGGRGVVIVVVVGLP